MNQHPNSSNQRTSDAALFLNELRGVFLPLPTPFNSNGDVDEPALRSNIQQWNDCGIQGYVILGSTGERANLDEAESFRVIEVLRSEISDRTASLRRPSFIVGAGQQSTYSTIKEIRRIAHAADAVLVITPHFYRAAINQQSLIDHFRAVAEASPVPLILYSMPALTGVKIEPETAARLSEHENIIGIKDSSADVDGLQATIKLANKNFAVFTGNGTVFCEGLRAGARGGILAVGCVAPALCLAIYASVSSGKVELATRLQSALTPLAAAVTTKFGIGGLKAALEMRGYVGGFPRPPLKAPDEKAREEIRSCLEVSDFALLDLVTQPDVSH